MAVAALAMYVAMILVIVVLRSVLQKRATGDSGIRAGLLDAAAGSIEWVAGWLLVMAVIAGFTGPVAELAGLDPLTESGWLRGVGTAVAAAGIVLTFVAQMSMGTEWRIGVDPEETTGLVSAGAFAVVRNPIFAAMIFTGVGLALMVPNPISIIGAVLLFVAIELQVRFVEEPHLRRLHGADYGTYASRVGRFAPGIGRN